MFGELADHKMSHGMFQELYDYKPTCTFSMIIKITANI